MKPAKQGYFILCLKSCDKIKLVNASNSVVKQVTAIVRRHCNIVRCGWDRHYAYSSNCSRREVLARMG